MPKRMAITCRSLTSSVDNTVLTLSRIMVLVADSKGLSSRVSGMKSPTVASSSSPTGVSSEIGIKATRWILRTLEGEVDSSMANSSGVGSRPYS